MENKPSTRYGRPGERFVDQTIQNHNQHRARLFITSDAVGEQTPDRSALARLTQYTSTKRYLTSSILASNYLELANPPPGGGEFGSDRSAGASCFLFFRQGGGGPSAEEQRIWSLAVEQDNENGYLFYQGAYPKGHFTKESAAAIKRLGLMPNGEKPVRVDLEQPIMNTGNIQPASVPDNMVFIPGGTFQMGDLKVASPIHAITLLDFYLSSTELTFGEYDRFCVATGRDLPEDEGWGRGQRPIVNVNWLDALTYCNWRSEQSGYTPVYNFSGKKVTPSWTANGYRLPTEAEWEYAARSGGKKQRFGNGEDVLRPAEANFNASKEFSGPPHSESGEYREQTIEVGRFSPNGLGLFDMSGNVSEWCWDWYDSDYYNKSPRQSPLGPSIGTYKITRGGSWKNIAVNCFATRRSLTDPTGRGNFIGFRLARSSK